MLLFWHLAAAFTPSQPVRTIKIASASMLVPPGLAQSDMDGLVQVSYNKLNSYLSAIEFSGGNLLQ